MSSLSHYVFGCCFSPGVDPEPFVSLPHCDSVPSQRSHFMTQLFEQMFSQRTSSRPMADQNIHRGNEQGWLALQYCIVNSCQVRQFVFEIPESRHTCIDCSTQGRAQIKRDRQCQLNNLVRRIALGYYFFWPQNDGPNPSWAESI